MIMAWYFAAASGWSPSTSLRPGIMGPGFRRDDNKLRLVRRVDHGLIQIALSAGGFRGLVVALNVAVLPAGDVVGRSGGGAAGAAKGIVVIGYRGDRSFVARGAGGEREGCEHQRNTEPRRLESHANSIRSSLPGLTRQSIIFERLL